MFQLSRHKEVSMRHSIVLALLALLVSVSLAAGASVPSGPFSTTGYTTNLVASDLFPFPIPSEIEFLPSGYVKFHIQAQGGPAFDDNTLCQSLYGVPCENLCLSVGGACGVSGFFGGSFSFDEWGVVDPTFAGANDGLLTITTNGGTARARFGGQAVGETVSGSFQFLGGTGDYRRLQGIGTYAGNAGYVFSVNYEPCGQPGQSPCPATLCGAQGEDLKLLRPKAMWTLGNYGQQTLRLESLLLHWPEQNGALTGVRLGGKLLATGSWNAPWAELDLSGMPARDREIRGGKSSKLMLDFANMGIGQAPAGYTFLARFEEGCSAIHVAFP
jgi:hypothetical protein